MTLRASIASVRDALRRLEAEALARVTEAYRLVEARLRHDLDALIAQIEAERARGVEVKPAWLFAQPLFLRLLNDLRTGLDGLAVASLTAITGTRQAALSRATGDAEEMIVIGAGHAPAEAISLVEAATRHSVPGPLAPAPAAVNIERQFRERLEGALVAGAMRPRQVAWERSLGGIEPVAEVQDAIAFGLATDRSGERIREDVLRRAAALPTRVATTLRTESMHAYRTAVLERFRSSGVVEGWVWVAELDSHTCPACAAMNGTTHPLDEEMGSHPCCRCIPAPTVLSWGALGLPDVPDRREVFPNATEAFNALSEERRLAILGRARLDAYESGRISLEDLVRPTASPTYGAGTRTTTLAELGLR